MSRGEWLMNIARGLKMSFIRIVHDGWAYDCMSNEKKEKS